LSNTIITENRTLTAKRAKFEEILYTGIIDNAEVAITLMDRNLGATSNNPNDENANGYYYQRGNNYGFKREDYINANDTFITNSYKTSNIIDGVSKPYYNEHFTTIVGNWTNNSILNLWG
jgi:hypothetical protein